MKFKNVTQLLDHFKDEATCREFLEQKRWGGTPACPFCGVINPYRTNRGFKCRDKQCHKKFTVTIKTVYENSKIPLRIWFAAIYLATSSKKGISSLQAARQLGISQKSAWFLNHRIRVMLTEKAPQMLSNTVQVDETYVGGKEGNKHASKRSAVKYARGGRSIDTKTPVLGLVESNGKVIAKVIPFVAKKGVSEIIHSVIEPNSTMVTDAFPMYKHLSKSEIYKHVVVDHKAGQYVNNGFHTNTIEGFFGLLKRGLYGIYHSVSPWHLQRYCNEFAFRYNTRKIADDERFCISIENCDGRLKYKDLIKTGV